MSKHPAPPATLAVASVHPDYLKRCLELCATGAARPPSLEPGTITLLRRTSGGLAGRHYGVVGIWWYTGESPLVRGPFRWPRRWAYQVQFAPLVREFSEPFSEMFTETPPGPAVHRGLKASAKVPGLVYTSLQGSIVQIRKPQIAAAYLRAILKEKQAELNQEVEYMGQSVQVAELLRQLVRRLEARESAGARG